MASYVVFTTVGSGGAWYVRNGVVSRLTALLKSPLPEPRAEPNDTSLSTLYDLETADTDPSRVRLGDRLSEPRLTAPTVTARPARVLPLLAVPLYEDPSEPRSRPDKGNRTFEPLNEMEDLEGEEAPGATYERIGVTAALSWALGDLRLAEGDAGFTTATGVPGCSITITCAGDAEEAAAGTDAELPGVTFTDRGALACLLGTGALTLACLDTAGDGVVTLILMDAGFDGGT